MPRFRLPTMRLSKNLAGMAKAGLPVSKLFNAEIAFDASLYSRHERTIRSDAAQAFCKRGNWIMVVCFKGRTAI
jgi:hypothetical protein